MGMIYLKTRLRPVGICTARPSAGRAPTHCPRLRRSSFLSLLALSVPAMAPDSSRQA